MIKMNYEDDVNYEYYEMMMMVNYNDDDCICCDTVHLSLVTTTQSRKQSTVVPSSV